MVMRNLFYLLLTSSIFIVLFLFLRAAFRKKTSMRLQYALWLLVLGKLLLPVPLLESPFSLFTVTQKADFKIQEQAPEMQSFQKNTNSYNDQLKNNGNQNRRKRRNPGARHRRHYNISADHNNISMRKIQHFGNSINHGIAQSNNRIYTSQTDTVD